MNVDTNIELDIYDICGNLYQLSFDELTLLKQELLKQMSNRGHGDVDQVTPVGKNHILIKLDKYQMTADNLEKFEYLAQNI